MRDKRTPKDICGEATPLQVSRSGANLLLRMVLPCAMLQIWCVQKELREKASACTCHSADWVTLHLPFSKCPFERLCHAINLFQKL